MIASAIARRYDFQAFTASLNVLYGTDNMSDMDCRGGGRWSEEWQSRNEGPAGWDDALGAASAMGVTPNTIVPIDRHHRAPVFWLLFTGGPPSPRSRAVALSPRGDR